MGNKKYWVITAISLVVVAIFVIGIPSTIIYQHDEGQEIDRLVEQAKLAVEMPTPPGKPEGKTEIVFEGKYLETKVPQLTCKGLKCRTTTKTVRTKVEIPVEKFVGPTNEEMSKWESEVAALERGYQYALQLEVQRLQDIEIAKKKAKREEIKDWVAIIGGIVSMIVGLISLILALRKHGIESRDSRLRLAPAPMIHEPDEEG